METLWQDLRFGLRICWHRPGFTIIAVLMLAIGIGVNSTLFSAVNAVLIRPMPYPDADRVVMIWSSFPNQGVSKFGAGYADIADWRDQSHVFERVAAFQASSITTFNLTGGPVPERVQATLASADFFYVLAVQPLMGRTFLKEEEEAGHNRVAVIGEGLWHRYFGGVPDVIGKQLPLNGENYTVIGVMPISFQFPSGLEMPPGAQFKGETELWLPLVLTQKTITNRLLRSLRAVARLKADVTLAQAQAEMNTIAARLAQQYPDTDGDSGILLLTLKENQVGGLKTALLILLAATALVLLIACANVSNLLLALASARQKELAIRAALGASRLRIVRQLLTESVLLSLLAGLLGILLAVVGIKLLAVISPVDLPRINETTLDNRVLIFTLLISLITGIVFGVAPAINLSHIELINNLKESDRGFVSNRKRNRIGKLLIISEVALAMILLIAAGLLLKSFLRVIDVAPGFDARNVLTMRVALAGNNYHGHKVIEFYQQLLARLKSVPGISSSGVIRDLPLGGTDPRYGFLIENKGGDPNRDGITFRYRAIGGEYFRAMGIELIKGRYFNEQDNENSPPVVIINEVVASYFAAGEDPIGKQLLIASNITSTKAVVVGVVKSIRFGGLDTATEPEIYFPFEQVPTASLLSAVGSMAIVMKCSVAPESLISAARNEIIALDKDLPISNIRLMTDFVDSSLAAKRFQLFLLTGFAIVALLLAVIGLYSLINYTVNQRTQEIGIRIALGAGSRDILLMIISQSMAPTIIGLGLGFIGAFIATRVMANLLFGISPHDPVTFTIVPVIFFVVALLACAIPAHRATRIDPNVALRYQ
jgi:predicted permease